MGRKKQSNGPARDLYAEIAARVVAAMSADGVPPWHRPWNPAAGMPRNAAGRRYRGVNVLLTWLTAEERGYQHPIWLTFKQANEIAARAHKAAGRKVAQDAHKRWVFADGEDAGRSCGGVRAGQNKANGCGATDVIFWKRLQRTEKGDDGEERTRSWPMMRSFGVFNLEQCDEIVVRHVLSGEAMQPVEPLEAAEAICDGFDVTTVHGSPDAAYTPSLDRIRLPAREAFSSVEAYYSVRFHEMGHATGHATRLGRSGITDHAEFASHAYSEEELVAEFTACFLCAEAGIGRVTEGTSVSYLKTWAAKIEDDPKIVVRAAQAAQKAADLILGRKAHSAAQSDEEAEEAA